MLESYFVDSCQLIETTRDDFGQEISAVTHQLNCRWRDITDLRRGSHTDTPDATAQVWFPAGTAVERGSILFYENAHYQIVRVTKAKRLGETAPQFVKCDVNTTMIGVS